MKKYRLNLFIQPEHAKRLDRLSRQVERIERDQNILIETLALYIRYYLTVILIILKKYRPLGIRAPQV